MLTIFILRNLFEFPRIFQLKFSLNNPLTFFATDKQAIFSNYKPCDGTISYYIIPYLYFRLRASLHKEWTFNDQYFTIDRSKKEIFIELSHWGNLYVAFGQNLLLRTD